MKVKCAVYRVCLQEANSHRRSLESEVKTRTSAMDAYDQMNSSLITANISLQVTSVTSAPCWSLLVLLKHAALALTHEAP